MGHGHGVALCSTDLDCVPGKCSYGVISCAGRIEGIVPWEARRFGWTRYIRVQEALGRQHTQQTPTAWLQPSCSGQAELRRDLIQASDC